MLIEGSYNYPIVFISIIVAIAASYSSLNIIEKISYARGRERYLWLVSGAVVMGGGVWSMHYLGMLALDVPMETNHDVLLTILSMLASIVSMFIAFYMIMPHQISIYTFISGGFFIGNGIIAMHYIGMSAVDMPAVIVYDTKLVILSVAIALLASYVTLFIFLYFRKQPFSTWLKWLAAFVMGSAISVVHYVAMKAISIHAYENFEATESSIDSFVVYSVVVTIFIILLISWGAMILDRHVLERMAFKDPLTGLSNRNEMKLFFENSVNQKNIGVMFLDLDEFKSINDKYGHDVGDKLIQEVAKRLKEFIQKDRKAFRIGGDEFLFVMEDCQEAYAKQLAGNILQSLKGIYYIDENELYITVSMGVSVGSISGSNTSGLLKEADIAMYRSKNLGKNQYCFYDKDIDKEVSREAKLESDIQVALENEQISVLYQPKWNVKEDCLMGFEVLLHWEHSQFGLISSNDFIPIAEKTRTIIPISLWALEKACFQCREWQSLGYEQPVSVNISARLFELDDLPGQVQFMLQKTGIDPRLLKLEISEFTVVNDVDRVISQLTQIRNLGIRISVDNFGSGYSSIGLLDRLPIDTLKLDQLFINNLDKMTKRAIIESIILMAEKLDLEVIVEGVESAEQVDALKQLGCYLMQGHYFSEPLSIEDVTKWMTSQRMHSCLSV